MKGFLYEFSFPRDAVMLRWERALASTKHQCATNGAQRCHADRAEGRGLGKCVTFPNKIISRINIVNNSSNKFSMKKLVFTAAMAILGLASANAQVREEFRQSQTRIQEPLQDVYIRPQVAELKMINPGKRSEWLPKIYLTQYSLNEITQDMLENAKANAAYDAAKEEDADIILAATFLIKNNPKGKGVEITVTGFPAKYVNWHQFGQAGYESDANWVGTLFQGLMTRTNREASTREESHNKTVKR